MSPGKSWLTSVLIAYLPFPSCRRILMQHMTFWNILAKGGSIHNDQFLLLPQCFWMSILLQRHKQVSICWKRLRLYLLEVIIVSLRLSKLEVILVSFKIPGSSVSSDAGCQSRCCEFDSRLCQLSSRRLTKVNATFVIHQWAKSMWKSSQLLGKIVV